MDAFNLSVFLRSGISSLQTLESLCIGISYFEHEKEIQFTEMFKALEACGGLPELKMLELELEGLDGNLESADWIMGFGKLCPKVERFCGDSEVWVEAVS